MSTTKEVDHPVFRRGKIVSLRPLCEEDLGLLTAWANDPEVNESFIRQKPTTLAMQKKRLEKGLTEETHDVFLGIIFNDTGKLIGTVGLHRVDLVHGTAWIGIRIGSKEHWAKGCGSEAVSLLLDYAFSSLNLRKVCWGSFSSNERSIGCAKKCGFKEESRMEKQYKRGGKLIDDVSLGLFAERWVEMKKQALS